MNYIVINMQNIKAVFDAAIKVVVNPPSKRKEKKKKQRHGCSLSSVIVLCVLDSSCFYCIMHIFYLQLHGPRTFFFWVVLSALFSVLR